MGRKPIPDPAFGHRLCVHCQKAIPLSELVSRVIQYGVRYERRCKACARAISKAAYGDTAEQQRQKTAEWRRNNPEKKKAYQKAYAARSREFIKAYEKQRREELTDAYIRSRMVRRDYGPRILSASDIPKELVDLKRMQILIKRQLKESTT